MNAPVTRRALLGATAAVGATALPVVADAASSETARADTVLLALIARHAAVDAAYDRADAEEDRLRAVALNAYPERPEAMRWRPEDFAGSSFGRGLSDPTGDAGERWYDFRGIEGMRDRPAPTWAFGPGDARGPAWETRRLEIVAAFDAWQAAKRAVDTSSGWDAASEAVCDLGDDLAEIEAEILATAPATLTGLAAKARWAGLSTLNDVTAGLWARQVVADVVAMTERGALGAAS